MSLVDAFTAELKDSAPRLAGNDELLRCVLAGSGDCIKILDLDGRLQFMSEGGKRVMEVDDFGKLKGCPWPDFWQGEGNKEAHAAVAAALAGRTYRFRSAANTARGNPRHWDVEVSPVPGPDGKPQYLLSISRDITAQVSAEAKLDRSMQRQRWLMGELAHRLKNTLAIIFSVANQTFRGAELAGVRETFLGRVKMLDSANDILTRTSWNDAPLSEIVETALAPHRTGQGRFSISGPPITIAAQQALTLALALHELATNALKYGAFSNEKGGVDIRWSADETSGFTFTWREHDGPAVERPTRQGFGSRLIARLTSDFGGTADLNYEPEGVVFRLTTALENIRRKDATPIAPAD